LIVIEKADDKIGRSGATAPTIANSNTTVKQIVRNIKSFVTRCARYEVWQKGFYDHVIRNEQDYMRIAEYIQNNPIEWTLDKYYSQ